MPRQRLRRPPDEQEQLRILRRDVRRKSHVRERRVRVRRSLHGLRRRLLEPDDRQRQLRNLWDDLRRAVDLSERRVPLALASFTSLGPLC
jgi:hypothetical protein